MAAFTVVEDRRGEVLLKESVQHGIDTQLELTIRQIEGNCIVANEIIQKGVSQSLKVAEYFLQQAGGMRLDEKSLVSWKAKNQYTRLIVPFKLPQIKIGEELLEKNESFAITTPIVDLVQNITGNTCTIFQRVNEKGDMLRVATNVPTEEGKRAVGTYIPAFRDNVATPVIETVVKKGLVYRGRAYVVNSWYLTAYAPLYGPDKKVIGMIYLGTKQKVDPNLRHVLDTTRITPGSYTWIMQASPPPNEPDFVHVQSKAPNFKKASDLKDIHGDPVLEELRRQIINRDAPSRGQIKVTLLEMGRPQDFQIQYAYFPEWDWIIGASARISDFQNNHIAFRETLGRAVKKGSLLLAALTLGIFLLATLAGRRIAEPITLITQISRLIAQGKITQAKEELKNSPLGQQLMQVTDERGDLRRSMGSMIEKLNVFSRDLGKTSKELSSATEQISSASRVQAGAVRDFTTSSQEIAVVVSEIDTTSQELSSTMEQVSKEAKKTVEFAGYRRQTIEKMQSSIHELGDAARLIAHKLDAIAESTQSINQVTSTIAKVADQTNMLSLNAAIEAEKAGEFGAGFLVVAKEIRRLADQTAQATLDIERTVKGVFEKVQTGVGEMNHFHAIVKQSTQDVEALIHQTQSIIDNVESLGPRFEEVEQGMSSQSIGARQISSALNALNLAARQTQTSLDGLRDTVGQFERSVEAIQETIVQLDTEKEN